MKTEQKIVAAIAVFFAVVFFVHLVVFFVPFFLRSPVEAVAGLAGVYKWMHWVGWTNKNRELQ